MAADLEELNRVARDFVAAKADVAALSLVLKQAGEAARAAAVRCSELEMEYSRVTREYADGLASDGR